MNADENILFQKSEEIIFIVLGAVVFLLGILLIKILALNLIKNNKNPPAKPGEFHMRAKPYFTRRASRRITV